MNNEVNYILEKYGSNTGHFMCEVGTDRVCENQFKEIVILVDELKKYQWQPVETAPKEHGARFLTYNIDIGTVICDRFDGDIVIAWNQEKYTQATHWMLLPAQPNIEPNVG